MCVCVGVSGGSLMSDAFITEISISVRSAVASKNCIVTISLDEILARGNWNTAQNFQNFYDR